MTTWKPGDVALVDSWRGERQIAFRVYRSGVGADWCVLDGTDTRGLEDSEIRSAHPVVVIDPDSDEDIERLAGLYWEAFHNIRGHPDPETRHIDGLADALREFTAPTPPKPAEPTGLGAVVEAADGERWVRWQEGPRYWVARPGTNAERWENVPAVRVLSEGVTP